MKKSAKKSSTPKSPETAPKPKQKKAPQDAEAKLKGKEPKANKVMPALEGLKIPGDKRVLVIDIGGSNVKLMIANKPRVKFASRMGLTPRKLVSEVLVHTRDWEFDAISIGFPAPVNEGRIVAEPANLGQGWLKFDLQKALGKPVKVINDAAMQALGSYSGGRMLFLGLGTGLGSALVHHGVLIPLELCEARFSKQLSMEDVLGKRGYKRVGPAKWELAVKEAVGLLRRMFLVDYVVLGGGNAKKLGKLPDGSRAGHNNNAYIGGVRLWEERAGCSGGL